MPWIRKQTTPEEIAEEVKLNLSDKDDNARVLILGTQTEGAYRMRMSIKNPEAVAGIIYNHAIKTGELNEALKMCEVMRRIADTAEQLIRKKVMESRQQN